MKRLIKRFKIKNMKNKILLILIVVLTIQCSSAQEINKDDYQDAIKGKWRLLSYDKTLEEYVESEDYLVFKANNILEEHEGNTLTGTLNYQISFSENINNGNTIKLASIKITDTEDGSYDAYQLDISLGENSVMNFTLEAQGTSVISLYKKVE
jgi:hypothetical protein